MNARVISMETDPRREHFAYFSAMADPYVGVTVETDVTALRAACRRSGTSFFLSLLYCAGRAVNAVPALRRRILDGQAVEFDRCDTSHTVMRPDETYGYCRLNCMQDFSDFLPEAMALHERAKAPADGALDDGDDAASLIFVSALPWLHYSALRQPTPSPADSNVRVSWGKAVDENGRTTLPMTLLAHHALADGLHLARFYEALERETAALADELSRSANC